MCICICHCVVSVSARMFSRYVFINDTATTEIYTLSRHDALPISWASGTLLGRCDVRRVVPGRVMAGEVVSVELVVERSEEHTSELQSRRKLVCRLLLEKQKEKLYIIHVYQYNIDICPYYPLFPFL